MQCVSSLSQSSAPTSERNVGPSNSTAASKSCCLQLTHKELLNVLSINRCLFIPNVHSSLATVQSFQFSSLPAVNLLLTIQFCASDTSHTWVRMRSTPPQQIFVTCLYIFVVSHFRQKLVSNDGPALLSLHLKQLKNTNVNLLPFTSNLLFLIEF